MTETQQLIGKFLDADVERDAIHIAVLPVIAAEPLQRGDYVKFAFNTHNQVCKAAPGAHIGIVDPFGAEAIPAGKRVWMFLQPNTVSGMRHHWQHPEVDLTVYNSSVNESEAWLQRFARQWNFNYDDMLEQATTDGEWRYIVAGGIDLHDAGELGGDLALFWQHIEALTGRKFSQEHKEATGWSCSC